jgi:hypothetical protein
MNNKEEQEYLKLKERNDKHKEKCRKYYQDNHEAALQKQAEARQTEERKAYMKEFRASEAGKKSARISNWKKMGLKSDDYNMVYDDWKKTTHCEECNVELIEGNEGANKKCLDHDHETGLFRNVICNRCNTKRGNDDRGVVRQSNEQYNENRNMVRKIRIFRLKWDLKKAFIAISQF